MSEGGGHYYDNSGYEFSHILKDASGQTSIIYSYDPNWSPLVSTTDEYWTTSDISKVRFHGQIMAIDKINGIQQYLTYATGKDVDISVNEYPNQTISFNNISNINIKNVPFIGNYSQEIINDASQDVFDLFKFSYSTYTIKNINNSSETYDVHRYDTESDMYVTVEPVTNDPLTFYKFSYDGTNWRITSPDGLNEAVYSSPKPNYGYKRITSFSYPLLNTNNICSERGTFIVGEGPDVPEFVPIDIKNVLNL
jgi:hypothetical protein